MAQIPVAPAKKRPAPINPVPARNHGFTKAASAVNAISISPAAIIT